MDYDEETKLINEQYKEAVADFQNYIEDYMANDNTSPYSHTEEELHYASLELGAGNALLRINNFEEANSYYSIGIVRLEDLEKDEAFLFSINDSLGELYKQKAEIHIINKEYNKAIELLNKANKNINSAIEIKKSECEEMSNDCIKVLSRLNVGQIVVDAMIDFCSDKMKGGRKRKSKRSTRKLRK